MGTRSLTIIVQDQQYRVAQYGQWDGYPDGQGQTVLDFLLSQLEGDPELRHFRRQVSRVTEYTQPELEEINRRGNWKERYPHLSRDMAARVLEYINGAIAPKLKPSEIEFAGEFDCEWAYVIDLDANRLEVYKGFNKTPLTESDRFYFLKREETGADADSIRDQYHPIKLVAAWPLAELRAGLMHELEETLVP